jgi:hypothetical protein
MANSRSSELPKIDEAELNTNWMGRSGLFRQPAVSPIGHVQGGPGDAPKSSEMRRIS